MGVRQYADAIASIESAGSGDYSAVGPLTKKGNRAYGRYQVMDFNVGPWTEKYLGQRLTPQQFLSSPEAQDKVFEGEFGGYVERYGNPQDAASVWFTGKPMSQGAGRSDVLGTTGAGYVQKFNSALGSPQGGKPMATGLLGNPTVSTQGQAPEQPKSIWGNKDMWDKLTIAFNSMRMRPDQGLAQAAQGRISERAKSAQTASQRNATADWLESQGAAELAAGVRSGAVPANAALQMALEKPKGAFRQVSGADLGMTGADAGKMFNVAPDGKITAIGGGGTTVNVGGEESSAFQEAVDKKFADRYLDWKTSGSADTSQQVAQISSVLSKLEGGEDLTGPMVAAIDAVGLGSILTPDAKDAKERVESVVQRSLRETLGAQFTEKEGERLIRRAYNPALPPEKNAARLRALYMTLSAADEAKRAMIAHVEANGTLTGYSGPQIPTASQMESAMESASPFGGGGGKKRLRYNVETGEFE